MYVGETPASFTFTPAPVNLEDKKDLTPDEMHFEYLEMTGSHNTEDENSRSGVMKYYKTEYHWGSGTEVSLGNRVRLPCFEDKR